MRHNRNKPINVSHDLRYIPSPSFAHATSSEKPQKISKSDSNSSVMTAQVLETESATSQAESTQKSPEIGSVWTQTPISKEPKRPEQSPNNLKSFGTPQSPIKSPLNKEKSGKSKVLLKGRSELPKNLASAKAPNIRQLSNSCSNYVASSAQKCPDRSSTNKTETGKPQNTTATQNNNSMAQTGKIKSPLNEETIAKIFNDSLCLENSLKPVVPQPNTVMHPVFDGSPTFCGGGQCVICVSLILHLTYTPAYNMNPLSVLCKLMNLKIKVSLTVRALFDNSL